MQVGKFRHRITVRVPSQSTDEAGQASYNFSSFDCWTDAKSIRGYISEAGMQEMAGRRYYKFTMRHDDRMDYGCEIVFRGTTYRPERIDRWDERDRYLIVYAYEVDL